MKIEFVWGLPSLQANNNGVSEWRSGMFRNAPFCRSFNTMSLWPSFAHHASADLKKEIEGNNIAENLSKTRLYHCMHSVGYQTHMTRKVQGTRTFFGTNLWENDLIHIGQVKPFSTPKLSVESISGIKNATRYLVFAITFFSIVKPIQILLYFRLILLEKRKINLFFWPAEGKLSLACKKMQLFEYQIGNFAGLVEANQ